MASKFQDSELLTKTSGRVEGQEVVRGKKFIGLYFSAHWCPPCRAFTPLLAEWYDKMKSEGKADELEIVFVSSDSDEKSFQEYFGSMPWCALPFRSPLGDQLSSEFGVRGIPMLVIIDAATGAVKDRDGRTAIAQSRGSIEKALHRWESGEGAVLVDNTGCRIL